MRTLVWFRGKDLRVSDHAPLRDAAAGEVLPVFVLEPWFFGPGRAHDFPHRMQFLLDSLRALDASLGALGSRLLLARGEGAEILPALAAAWRADRVVAHRRTEPAGRRQDARAAQALRVPLTLYEGETLLPPGTLRTGSGKPYAVFSQFARAFEKATAAGLPPPVAAPASLPPIPADVAASSAPLPACAALGLSPNPRLRPGGEPAARDRLARFLAGAARDYPTGRDRLDQDGASGLSADLKFGTLSVRTAWHESERVLGDTEACRAFRRQLLWRDFTHSTLWDRPELLSSPFRPEYGDFPWVNDEARWRAWVEGKTGYPVVDAAARQLLGEGFVHNRARMIAASFLTRQLAANPRQGEAHYFRYLVDGDRAQNNFNWQWSAGCGCDAQPYFRVFNPVSQGERFDPAGDYVRRWVPELAAMPARHIHAPWLAPADVLRAAGVRLGQSYPRPIVEHRAAREAFLALARGHLKRRAAG